MSSWIIAYVCAVFLVLAVGSLAFSSEVPHVADESPSDFLCVSGQVEDSSTGDPIAGVSICVFPEGIAPDSGAPSGSIHEGGVEFPLPPVPTLYWVDYTDSEGNFSVCCVPGWLSEHTFTVIIYRPNYEPRFEEGVLPELGPEPMYTLAVELTLSEL